MPDHCREGIAIVREDGKAVDTFWMSGSDHVLDDAELESATLRFRLPEFHEVDRWEWVKYAPEDRASLTRQHGMVAALYVRNGAEESIETQTKAAYAELREAEQELQSAGRKIEWAARKIAGLEAKRES